MKSIDRGSGGNRLYSHKTLTHTHKCQGLSKGGVDERIPSYGYRQNRHDCKRV
jgi:hypothetical protein